LQHLYVDNLQLPRKGMHKRGTCHWLVSVCPSHSCIVSKRLKLSSSFFLGLVAPLL